MLKAILAAAFLAGGYSVSAQAQAVEDWTSRLDTQVMETGGFDLDLHFEGEPDGFMRFGWYVDGQTLHLWDRTMWASREIYESFEAELDARDLTPSEVRLRFHQETAYFTLNVSFEPGLANAEVTTVRPGEAPSIQSLEADLSEGTLVRATAFAMASIVPLEVGEAVAFDWYAPMSNSTASVTLRAVEAVTVETPAGTFDTIRIELRGGQPPNDIYVVPDTRRIVRIDVGGMPMQFLARPDTE